MRRGIQFSLAGLAGLLRATKRVYKMLIARGRSVRICRIDDYGTPWFQFHFRRNRDGWRLWESLSVCKDDSNWVPAKPRPKRRTSGRLEGRR
jgi:hypothetical protein